MQAQNYAPTCWIVFKHWVIAMQMDLSTKIRRLREARGIRQGALADALGVSQATVSRWEKGASPTGEHIQQIASYFNQSVDVLCGTAPQLVDFHVVVVGSVEAGAFAEAMEFYPDDQYLVQIPTPRSPNKDKAYGLEVHGTSMDQVYADGTILICLKLADMTRDLRNGDHVIAIRIRDGLVEATCKEYRMTEDGAWLWPRSNDPKHQSPTKAAFEPTSDDDSATVDAVVIGAYIDRS
jgi:transcriptional regulator with XRE-family HTH domain